MYFPDREFHKDSRRPQGDDEIPYDVTSIGPSGRGEKEMLVCGSHLSAHKTSSLKTKGKRSSVGLPRRDRQCSWSVFQLKVDSTVDDS